MKEPAPLLVTKLYFSPARSQLVARPQLVSRLEAGLQGPLTLIAAPAGYGKTTLLGEWRLKDQGRTPVAWLSLEPDDNELARFWQYLIAAFETIQTGLTADTGLLLQTPPPPGLETIATRLLNALSQHSQDLVLVLDDCHVITLPAIHASLKFLIEHLPPQIHLVMLTRADPALPLGRLRARGQLVEIRATELRFHSTEAAAFLNQIMGLDLTLQEVTALEMRTEGWIAGLQLAALSMQGRTDRGSFIAAFTGSNQYIGDYLAEEVLNRQPAEVRSFLLKTAILDRLCGPLCDALTGRRDGQQTLEQLAAENLFLIPLDDEQYWFRYHQLFMDLLRKQLQQSAPQSEAALHLRAAQWYENQRQTGSAVEHALKAQAYDRVEALISTHWLQMGREQQLSTLVGWIEALPESIRSQSPNLMAILAFGLWSMGLRGRAEVCLQQASQLMEARLTGSAAQDSSQMDHHLQAEITAFQSLISAEHGQFDQAVILGQQALSLATDHSALISALANTSLYVAHRAKLEMEKAIRYCKKTINFGRQAQHHVMVVDASYNLSGLLVIQGRLDQAEVEAEQNLQYIQELGQARLPVFSIAYLGLAEIHYLRHELDQAADLIKQAVELSAQSGRPASWLHSQIIHAKVQAAWGQLDQAIEMLNQVRQASQQAGIQVYSWQEASAWLMRLQARQGNLHLARRWLAQLEFFIEPPLSYPQMSQAIHWGHILLALGELEQAKQVLAILEPICQAGDHRGWWIEVLLLSSRIWAAQQESERALQVLEQALAMAAPQQYRSPFLAPDAGLPPLLHSALQRSQDPGLRAFIQSLLGAPAPTVKSAQPEQSSLLEPLSGRELQVLRLIAAGYSNKEIASELVIALGTVKRHTVNIYNKLVVKNRTEAVARARDLGLL